MKSDLPAINIEVTFFAGGKGKFASFNRAGLF
jgi:hypothetical protein